MLTGEGVDYVSGPYYVTFPAGIKLASFNVPIINDIVMENDENFNLTIDGSLLPRGFNIINHATCTVTIVDDDGNMQLRCSIIDKIVFDLPRSYMIYVP